jgi:hypothetical protein
MEINAQTAKEWILSGKNLDKDIEDNEQLDLSKCIIPTFPNWTFLEYVSLDTAKLDVLRGNFKLLLNARNSSVSKIENLTVGCNNGGQSAIFDECKSLQIANGNFKGSTTWINSGITMLESGLKLGSDAIARSTYPMAAGYSADFSKCTKLKKVQGIFPGSVTLDGSGVNEIDPSTKFSRNKFGDSAFFNKCKSLHHLAGNYPGAVHCLQSEINSIDKEATFGINNEGISLNFLGCKPQRFKIRGPLGKVIGPITFYHQPPSLEF